LNAADPVDRAKLPWWELPGGGVDAREDTAAAVARELHEEAGLSGARIGPVVWTQHAQFTFAGYRFDQHEQIHVAWHDAHHTELTYAPTRHEALEALAFKGLRWWHPDELHASAEPTVPLRLREFLPALLDGTLPDVPVDITPLDS
jgi:8-oxo-dGTP pyrophosphatase MutT (NUDIX family)